MRIRTTIHVALGTVLVLHVFTAVMGHVGLEKSQRDLSIYEGVNTDTIRVLAIDKEIAELQRNVSTYMLNGHSSAAERVRELLEQVHDEIQVANEQTTQSNVREQLELMDIRIDSFEFNFEKVVVDREAQKHLVHEIMFPTKDQILKIISASSSMENELLYRVRDRVYMAENSVLRYFDSPGLSKIDDAMNHLTNAEELLDELGSTGTDVDHIGELVTLYKQTFLKAVQSTQGYLHLVHVVLAGETAELLYQSAMIRDASLTRRDTIRESMVQGAKRFQAWSDWVAVLTVLAGMMTAMMLTRSVLGPILNLTGTFKRLSEGEGEAEIMYSHRGDEIGMMAKAAEVFRLKNVETEQLLENSQRMASDLERRNNEMTQFVYTVSHDLKSPLVTIQCFASVVLDSMRAGDLSESEEMLLRIYNASKRMSQTVDELLELSRIGMVVHEPEKFNFGETTEEVLQDLSALMEESNAQVQIQGGEHSLFGDQIRIRQVLQNLIQNAIVYGHSADSGSEIEVMLEQRDGQSIIGVLDSGPGIDARFHEKVFGIFQRLSTDTEGTGVGLAVVRKVAVAHGGLAWVENRPNGGAAFYVSIPNATEGRIDGSNPIGAAA